MKKVKAKKIEKSVGDKKVGGVGSIDGSNGRNARGAPRRVVPNRVVPRSSATPRVAPRVAPRRGSPELQQDVGLFNRWREETEPQVNNGASGSRQDVGLFNRWREETEPQVNYGAVAASGIISNGSRAQVNPEKRLDDWINEQNNKIIDKPANIARGIPEISRMKTAKELSDEDKAAKNIRDEFYKEIGKGERNSEKCPICMESFLELSAETDPKNKIYSCKNTHLVCGNCKSTMDKLNKVDGYLWAHTTPIWKCHECRIVSRNADRLEKYEKAFKKQYKKSQGKSSKSTGGSPSLYKNVGKKEILGKIRNIYKMKGSNKEYVKNKGTFIHLKEYKKMRKARK